MNELFGQMGTQAPPTIQPLQPTPIAGIVPPEITMPKTDPIPKVQPANLEAPTETSRWQDIYNQPGFTQGLFAFSATMFQGGDVGTAGLNFMKSLEAASDKEELKKQHETQRRLLAAQQVRENDFKERQVRTTEALAGSTIQDRAAKQDLGNKELIDKQKSTNIKQQAESRQAQDSATSRMKDIKTIQKIDAETTKLIASQNAPSEVDLDLWKAAVKMAPKKTNELGDVIEPNVEDGIREYNKLATKKFNPKFNSTILNDKVEEALEETVQDPSAGERAARALEEVYGEAAAKKFAVVLSKKVAKRRGELGESENFGKPQSGLFDMMNLGGSVD